MRKVKIFASFALTVMIMSLVASCGGNESESEIVDGVHIQKGKKLTSVLDLSFNLQANAYYDNKNRLNKIEYLNRNDSTICEIDYDHRIINYTYAYKTIGNAYNHVKRTYTFLINEQGYISIIDNMRFIYNSDGFLTNFETSRALWDLIYKDDDLDSFIGNFLKSEKEEIYVCFYDNVVNYYIRTFDDSIGGGADWFIGLIAYHSGLFGRTTKHFNYWTESDLGKATFKTSESKYERIIQLNYE
jgi:hypothetical protein